MKKICPLLKKECLEHGCEWFVAVRLRDPQTGNELDDCRCAIAWMPKLQLEVAAQVRQGAAATEGVRNELHANAAANVMRALARISEPFQDPRKELEHKP